MELPSLNPPGDFIRRETERLEHTHASPSLVMLCLVSLWVSANGNTRHGPYTADAQPSWNLG